MPSMAAHVIDHEPHTALFVPDGDPLLFYRAIARKGNCGWLYFEVHESHAEEVCAMLAEEGFVGIELRRDLNGRERMVRARKTPKA